MEFNKLLITGSCGLIGSEAVRYFSERSNDIIGIDDNGRAAFFGEEASILPIKEELEKIPNYRHLDIEHNHKEIINQEKPDVVIHCAGQPSHDFSASNPRQDWLVNAGQTFEWLNAVLEHSPDSIFIFTSTNKVYGNRPNQLPIIEKETRYEFSHYNMKGINETLPIDQCMHTPFGASKTSADLLVQEYGNYFGIKTACFRCGCITGSAHQGVELHGFLSYLCKAAKEDKEYTIYGNGKQVRDNLHSYDLITAFHEFLKRPQCGSVFNIGGGPNNTCSIIEAINDIETKGFSIKTKHDNHRLGDHMCYYTDNSKFKKQYPDWAITKNLKNIFTELLED